MTPTGSTSVLVRVPLWRRRCYSSTSHTRLASIARKLYLRQGIGLGTFKKIYGRRERRGVMPIRFREGSGSIARWILKELERLKVVEKDKNGYVALLGPFCNPNIYVPQWSEAHPDWSARS